MEGVARSNDKKQSRGCVEAWAVQEQLNGGDMAKSRQMGVGDLGVGGWMWRWHQMVAARGCGQWRKGHTSWNVRDAKV